MPEDCEQANITFQTLHQSTASCFKGGNIPVEDVAKKILEDAETLRTVIDELQKVNPNTAEDCSSNYNDLNNEENFKRNNIAEEFNYHKIKNDVKIEISKDGSSTKKQWCYYNA